MEVKTAAQRRIEARNAAILAEYATLTGRKMAKYEHLASNHGVSKWKVMRLIKSMINPT